MTAASTGKKYTVGVCPKLTPETFRAVMEASKAEGLRVGEWCRRVIEAEVSGSCSNRILLAEVMALRVILLTLQGSGVTTKEKLDALVSAVESRKFALADGRIQAGKNL